MEYWGRQAPGALTLFFTCPIHTHPRIFDLFILNAYKTIFPSGCFSNEVHTAKSFFKFFACVSAELTSNYGRGGDQSYLILKDPIQKREA